MAYLAAISLVAYYLQLRLAPNVHKRTERMLKSIVAPSCILMHVCLLVVAVLVCFWHTNCSIASVMHCDKQQLQLQPLQRYAHTLAQLCDLYSHTAMLLHPLLAVAAQPRIDAAALLGTTL